MHTTKRSRKYRKERRNRGGPKFNPEVAGLRRKEREEHLRSARVVMNHPSDPDMLDVSNNEDFD